MNLTYLFTLMFFNNETLIVIIVIFVLSVFLYTLYNNIFTIIHNTSNKFSSFAQWEGLYNSHSYLPSSGYFNILRLRLLNFKLAISGVVSTQVVQAQSTVVELTDVELNQLLEPILNGIVGNVITTGYLKSFGLFTPSVISYLQGIGYTIIG